MTVTVGPPAPDVGTTQLEHPVAVLVQRLSARLDEVVDGPSVWSMTADEQVATCSPAASASTRPTFIKKALERLPQHGPFAVTCDQVESAEAQLVAWAGDFDATKLEVLGQKIFEVVAPEAAESAEAALLSAQEERAARSKSLRTWRDGESVTHGRFAVPDLHGDMLRTMTDALASPLRHQPSDAAADAITEQRVGSAPPGRAPSEQRRGEAVCEMLERLPAADLPTAGGGDATVVVTMRHEQLLRDLEHAGVVTLDTGSRITAAEAARPGCSPRPSGSRSRCATAAARPSTATCPPRCATPTTTGRGRTAGPPTSPTPACSAPAPPPGPRSGLLAHPHHRRGGPLPPPGVASVLPFCDGAGLSRDVIR